MKYLHSRSSRPAARPEVFNKLLPGITLYLRDDWCQPRRCELFFRCLGVWIYAGGERRLIRWILDQCVFIFLPTSTASSPRSGPLRVHDLSSLGSSTGVRKYPAGGLVAPIVPTGPSSASPAPYPNRATHEHIRNVIGSLPQAIWNERARNRLVCGSGRRRTSQDLFACEPHYSGCRAFGGPGDGVGGRDSWKDTQK